MATPLGDNGGASIARDDARNDDAVDVSVVVPVLNERDGLDACHRELSRVLSATRYRYQLIFVDDGSTDGSWSVLKHLQATGSKTVCIRLRRNIGQQQALLVGLRHAAGRAVITYDADMQCEPECVPMLAAKIFEGYDLAGGIRIARRRTPWPSRLQSTLGRYLINHVLQINQQDFGSVKAYSSRLVADVLHQSHAHTVIPALAHTLTRNSIETPVGHRLRATGQSKWNLLKRAETFLHVYASHVARPFDWLFRVAWTSVLLGLLAVGGTVLAALFDSRAVGQWLVLDAFVVVTAIAMFGLALHCRRLIRTYRGAAVRGRGEELIDVILGETQSTGATASRHVDAP